MFLPRNPNLDGVFFLVRSFGFLFWFAQSWFHHSKLMADYVDIGVTYSSFISHFCKGRQTKKPTWWLVIRLSLDENPYYLLFLVEIFLLTVTSYVTMLCERDQSSDF